MKCAYCEAMIDDDSYFCDQCGEQIMVCSSCGKPGKGKRCIYDGKPLATAKAYREGSDTVPSEPSVRQVQTGDTTGGDTAGPAVLHLINHNREIDLTVRPDSVIGRATGEHVSILGNFDTISGTHARIEFRNNIWYVVDLGSTNGTYVNDNPVPPQQPVPLSEGTIVVFADVEFVVRIQPANGQTGRNGTVRF